MAPTLTLPAVPHGLLRRNRFIDAAGGATFDVTDPATDAVIASIADASPADALAALSDATDAQPAWAATAPRRRADILRAAYELVLSRTDELALLMTMEMGKPLGESRSEVIYAAEFLRWFSEEATRIRGEATTAPSGDSRIITRREPVGPCLLVTPWNFPLAMATRKIAPALAAGCTVIVKPATATPLTTLAFGKLLIEAGAPHGVVSILPTSQSPEVVAILLSDPRLRKVSFTGSTTVGTQLIAQSAPNVLRMSMELGGNAPLIVCADADIPHAVAETLKAKLRNNGEACTAANTIYVHDDVAAEFTAMLARAWSTLCVGPGYVDGNDVGPVISHDAVHRINSMIEEAITLGASVAARVDTPPGSGSYVAPTLLMNVPPHAQIVREEIFGPVAPILTWRDEAHLLATLNAGQYGLAGYLFSRDPDTIRRIAEHLEVGMIGVNRGVLSNVAAPFGGVKHSGFGREGGATGIDEYLTTKYLAVDASDRP